MSTIFKSSSRFVSFLNSSLDFLHDYLQDNQSGGEVTQIDYLSVIGTPIDTTNMKDFKRVSGKKGETE